MPGWLWLRVHHDEIRLGFFRDSENLLDGLITATSESTEALLSAADQALYEMKVPAVAALHLTGSEAVQCASLQIKNKGGAAGQCTVAIGLALVLNLVSS